MVQGLQLCRLQTEHPSKGQAILVVTQITVGISWPTTEGITTIKTFWPCPWKLRKIFLVLCTLQWKCLQDNICMWYIYEIHDNETGTEPSIPVCVVLRVRPAKLRPPDCMRPLKRCLQRATAPFKFSRPWLATFLFSVHAAICNFDHDNMLRVSKLAERSAPEIPMRN